VTPAAATSPSRHPDLRRCYRQRWDGCCAAREGFRNELFRLPGLDPRAAHSLDHEQIDGSFSFETDDYLLEAKWRKTAMEREHAGIFTVKPGPRGKPASAAVVRLAIGEPETFGARARNSRRYALQSGG